METRHGRYRGRISACMSEAGSSVKLARRCAVAAYAAAQRGIMSVAKL